MAEETKVNLDLSQVKKAVQALQAFLKTKAAAGDSLFPDEPQTISLLFTLWRIPKASQKIFIPLPHGQQSDTDEICLFTKDEPRMTSDQTQRFYQKLLQEKAITNISEIIPYKVLKTEYKPYEAKRRLLKNFQVFLSDDRVYRLLPSHLGKHFYDSKKPLVRVNLQSKHLARDIQRVLRGTSLTVTNKGSCCMAHVAHSDMTADEVTQNIEEAVKTVVAKLRMKGRVMKLIHVKSHSSVALPIYTSDLSHLCVQDAPLDQKTADQTNTEEDKKQTDKEKKLKKRKTEEEIPQLVPMETPSKTPKLEKPFRKQQLQKATQPAAVRRGAKGQSKVTQKAKVRKGAKGQNVTQKAGNAVRGRKKGAPVR